MAGGRGGGGWGVTKTNIYVGISWTICNTELLRQFADLGGFGKKERRMFLRGWWGDAPMHSMNLAIIFNCDFNLLMPM